jgi:transcriptional regulator with XRE-family HTH domain
MKKIIISEKIKSYRKENRITQEEFGCIMGVSAQAVSKWENETCYPDITFLPDIAEVLGCGIDELFGV